MNHSEAARVPRTHAMHRTWKLCLFLAGGLGLVAVGAAAIELAGLEFGEWYAQEMTESDAWVALGVGLVLNLFAWTGMARARVQLDSRSIRYLRFGPICTTASVDLDSIRRFGVGTEKHGYRRDQILLLELHDGSKRSIKISMYERWKEFVAALGEALGQEEVAGKQGFLGARLEEESE